MDHKEFFNRYGKNHFEVGGPFHGYMKLTIEDLYQAFKARLLEEIEIEKKLAQ